jgi:nicotinamide-nucleotide amidase
MHVEILMIGTELLIGQINDTNATRMAQALAANGVNLYQKTTVGDNPGRIVQALRQALARSPIVLCSGGLGPTEDDITRECVAEVFGVPLEYRPELFESIVARFSHLRHLITENNKKQATLPVGTVALDNPNGTAPGVLLEGPAGTVLCMPGVPFELDLMMERHVLPYLRSRLGIPGILHYRVLKVSGVGESRIDAEIGDLMNQHDNPTVGLLASPDVVRIRIAARAPSREAADALIAPVEAAIRARIGDWILGADDDTLEGVIDRLLAAQGLHLAVIETATGGLVAHRLTAAGATQFVGGRVLGAHWRPPEGGAGAEVAFELAREGLVSFSAESVLALVPAADGNQCHAALLLPGGSQTWEFPMLGEGTRRQLRAAVQALEGLRRRLLRSQAL